MTGQGDAVGGDEEVFRRIVESSRDGIWVLDRTGRTLHSNRRTAELLGRTPEQMQTLSVLDVLDAAGQQQFAAHLADLRLHGPAQQEVECCYRLPDGSPVYLVVSESVLLDEDGSVRGYVHRLTDDADRRALINELSRSREQLDEAQAIAGVGSWELDLDTGDASWSRQMYVILGEDPATCTPRLEAFMAHILDDDRDAAVEELQRVRDGAPGIEFDVRLLRTDGEVRWVRGLGRTAYDDDGRAVRLSGTVQDITAMKDVELQLLDAVVLNMTMQMMAAAANGAETLDEAFEVTRQHLLSHHDWQRAVAFLVVRDRAGTRLEPWRGHPPTDAPGPDLVPTDAERRTAWRVLSSGRTVFEEEAHPEAPSIGFLLTVGGEPTHVVVVTARSPFERHAMLESMAGQVAGQLVRVAERERAASELAVARDTALEASRLKSEFLAMMSHEIRTPMNGVIGLNELLLGTRLDPHQRRLAEAAQLSGSALLGIINDVLDFSKIEAGELALEAVEFELRPVFDQVEATLAATAEDKGVDLAVDVAPDVPAWLVGDPTRLGQVVSNLVSNAVKFTPAGRVDVHVGVASVEGKTILLEVAVVDTGIGIDPAQLDRLFEPFRQADASTTRLHGGSGLGLAISRRLVTALGGDLRVSSVPGEGSRFWFTARFLQAVEDAGGTPVPDGAVVTAATDGVRPPGAALRETPAHVLVVEDNQVNQMVAAGLLSVLGYTAEVVDDGLAAVRRAREAEYDAILMDLRMPQIDGYAAARMIRDQEPQGCRVPIIAMTASAVEGEHERCLAAGMDDFITKPVSSSRLGEVLAAHLGRPSSAGPSGARNPNGSRPAQVPAGLAPRSAASGRSAGGRPPRPDPSRPAVELGRLEELDALGGGAVALVTRAVDKFVQSVPSTLTALRAALAAGAHSDLTDLAHRFRGSALNLGAVRVAELSLELELLGHAEAASRGPGLVEQLERAAAEAAAALTEHRLRRTAS